MSTLINKNLDYDSYVKIADDVFWVGYADIKAGLQCNPYLIIDQEEVFTHSPVDHVMNRVKRSNK